MSTSISGSVADTCRGGIDLGGAASPRLISPAASVYAVSRDVEVIVVRVGLIVAPGFQAALRPFQSLRLPTLRLASGAMRFE